MFSFIFDKCDFVVAFESIILCEKFNARVGRVLGGRTGNVMASMCLSPLQGRFEKLHWAARSTQLKLGTRKSWEVKMLLPLDYITHHVPIGL